MHNLVRRGVPPAPRKALCRGGGNDFDMEKSVSDAEENAYDAYCLGRRLLPLYFIYSDSDSKKNCRLRPTPNPASTPTLAETAEFDRL